MISAPAHLIANYTNGDERPIHAYDDDGYPLTPNSQGALVRADNWPGYKGTEQLVDDTPKMAVPGQGWQIEFTVDGDTWRTPVVAFAIDYAGFATPIAQEEDGGGIWAIDLNETSRLAGSTARLIPPDVPQPAPRPNTAEEIAEGKVIL